jgi:hypothetical protein
VIRVLLTGSRHWVHTTSVRAVLDGLYRPDGLTLVHGAASRGADAIAAAWVRTRHADGWNVTAEAHPADWQTHRRRAGIVRNNAMVSLGADVVVAFLRDGSAGTSHCIAAAKAAGLTVRVYDWAGREQLRGGVRA